MANATTWQDGFPRVVYLVSCGIATFGSLAVTRVYVRTAKARATDVPLYSTCRSVADLVERESGGSIPLKCIGVNVWAVRGFYGVRYLKRIAIFTESERTRTAITWRKGKGQIGSCWSLEVARLENHDRHADDYSNEAAYASLDKSIRRGISWRERQKLGRYRAVLSIPLTRSTATRARVAGVLAIDIAGEAKPEDLETVWVAARQTFDTYAATCEALLGWRDVS